MDRFGGGEEGEGGVAERFQCPEAAAAVEATAGLIERAQRIGGGEAFQGGAAEPAAAPQIGGVGVTGTAVFDEAFCIGFGEALDLPQPKAKRATITRHQFRRPGESRDPLFHQLERGWVGPGFRRDDGGGGIRCKP